MIIVAGGDSFVYGNELADCNHTYSVNTFSALLSGGNDYVCSAWPGFGNDSIARTVISQCEQLKHKKPFVIVSWTFPGRYEFRFSYHSGQRTGHWYTITPWSIESPENIQKEYVNYNSTVDSVQKVHLKISENTGTKDFAKAFYQHVGGSEYWEIYSSLKEIVYLQNYLKSNNIGYMFTCADNSIMYNRTVDQGDAIIASLIGQIDHDSWFWFAAGSGPYDTQNPRGFYQWAVENKYSIGTTHPLEDAHQAAANLMKDKFNELVTKHIQ